MAVFRIERTRDYTVMSNHHLRNANLSLKAKGLLSMMLSLPEDVYKRQDETASVSDARLCSVWRSCGIPCLQYRPSRVRTLTLTKTEEKNAQN